MCCLHLLLTELLIGTVGRGGYEARVRELLERCDPIFVMTIEAMLDVRRAAADYGLVTSAATPFGNGSHPRRLGVQVLCLQRGGKRHHLAEARQASAISEAMSSSGRRLKSFREFAYNLASRVAVEVLAHLAQGAGVGDNDQVFYGPVQAELVQERGRRCREVVLDEPDKLQSTAKIAIMIGPPRRDGRLRRCAYGLRMPCPAARGRGQTAERRCRRRSLGLLE